MTKEINPMEEATLPKRGSLIKEFETSSKAKPMKTKRVAPMMDNEVRIVFFFWRKIFLKEDLYLNDSGFQRNGIDWSRIFFPGLGDLSFIKEAGVSFKEESEENRVTAIATKTTAIAEKMP